SGVTRNQYSISMHNRLSEPGSIYPNQIVSNFLTCWIDLGIILKRKYSRSLSHCFDNQYARHYRMMRKMTSKKRFIISDIFDGNHTLGWDHLNHTINKQHRIAMW